MRDVAEQTDRSIYADGTPIHLPEDEPAAAILFVGSTTEPVKDELLAMLSHELRTPLAAIENAVQLLSSQTGETPARNRTQALIERQVRRMTQLVDELLDVSRISRVTAARAGLKQGSEFTVRLPTASP
jgi:signal transduction histidine kinase